MSKATQTVLDSIEYPFDAEAVVKDITVSVEWLQQLHTTISREGVSSDDIDAVHQIRSKLMAMGVEFDPTPAIEHYPPQVFLDERTSMNLSVGLEGIAQTIVQTIRTWIRKLIDYVKRIYQWVKKTVHGEDRLVRMLETYSGIFAAARAGRKELVDAARHPTSDNYNTWIKKEKESFLSSGSLTPSPLQLAVLGHKEFAERLRSLEQNAHTLVNMTQGMLQELQSIVEGDPKAIGRLDDSARTVGTLVLEQLQNMQQEMPQRNYIKRNIDALQGDRKYGYDIFSDALPSVAYTVSRYEYLFEVHQEMLDALNKLKPAGARDRAEPMGNEEITTISSVLSEMTQHVDVLKTLGVFFHNTTRLKMATLRAFYEFEQQAFQATYKDLVDQATDQAELDRLTAIRDRVVADIHAASK